MTVSLTSSLTSSMTSLERVLAALSGSPKDRLPFTMTLSQYGVTFSQSDLRSYYSDPHIYARGQNALHEKLGQDIIFAPFILAYEAAAFGCELQWYKDAPPVVKKPAADSALSFLHLKHDGPDKDPFLSYIRGAVQELAQKHTNQVPVCGIAVSPVDLPALVLGIDKWIEILITDEKSARDILDISCAHFISYANALLDAGASFIASPMMCTNPRLLYKNLIRTIISPAVSSAFSAVKGPVIYHHGGNPIADHLEDIAGLPNTAGFVLDAKDSFASAREKLGPDRLLLGNISGPTIGSISTEILAGIVNKLLDSRTSDSHYIFATSAADIPPTVPFDRIETIRDVVISRGAHV